MNEGKDNRVLEKVKYFDLRTCRVKNLIILGRNYREIQNLLGVSLNVCVKANKEMISGKEFVRAEVVRQMTRLYESGESVEIISQITGINEFMVHDVVKLIEIRIKIEGLILLFTKLQGNPEMHKDTKGRAWSHALKMLWRDMSLGSVDVQQLKNGRFQLERWKFSKHSHGYDISIYSDYEALGIKLRELFSSGRVLFYGIDGKKKKLTY